MEEEHLSEKEWFEKGIEFESAEQYQDAIKCFDKVVDLDPNNASAWLHNGISLEALGDYQEAIFSYEEAFRLDSSLTRASELKTNLENNLKNERLDKGIEYENAKQYQNAINLEKVIYGPIVKKSLLERTWLYTFIGILIISFAILEMIEALIFLASEFYPYKFSAIMLLISGVLGILVGIAWMGIGTRFVLVSQKLDEITTRLAESEKKNK